LSLIEKIKTDSGVINVGYVLCINYLILKIMAEKISGKPKNIVLKGATGGIGSATLELLTTQNKHRIVAITNTSGAVFDNKKIANAQESIRDLNLNDADKSRAAIREIMAGNALVDLQTTELLQALKDHGIENNIVIIDATSANNYDLHLSALEAGHSVVTAAKGPIVESSMAEYNALMAHSERYGYEATLMAGRGAYNLLEKQREIGDTVTEIKLISSGSIGGTLADIYEGKSTAEACRNNDSKFEPEPYLDLSGKDLGGKLLTALREVGLNYELSDIMPHITGLVTDEYAGMDKSTFYEAIESAPEEMGEIIQAEKANGKKPVYVASFILNPDGTKAINIGLEFVPTDSAMGVLQGSENLIQINTKGIENAGDQPDKLIGAGAGRYATGKGLVADIPTA